MKSQFQFGQFVKRYGGLVLGIFVIFAMLGSFVENWQSQQQQQSYQESLNNDWPPQGGYPPYVCYRDNSSVFASKYRMTLPKGSLMVLQGRQCFDIDSGKRGKEGYAIDTINWQSITLLVSPHSTLTGTFSFDPSNKRNAAPLIFNDVHSYCGWTREKPLYWNYEQWIYPNETEEYSIFQNGTVDTSSLSYDNSGPGLDAVAKNIQKTCATFFPTPKDPETLSCGNTWLQVGNTSLNTDGYVIPSKQPNWANYYQLTDSGDPYALVLHVKDLAMICVTEMDTGNTFAILPNPQLKFTADTFVLRSFQDFQVQIWTWKEPPQGYVVPWGWFGNCSYVHEQNFGSFQTIAPETDGDGVAFEDHSC